MKNIRLNRFLSFALCAVMVITIFSSCGSNAEESSGNSPDSQATDSSQKTSDSDQKKGSLYIEGSEGVTLSYWIPIDNLPAQNYATLAEHPYFQWLQEETGVTIEFIHPSYEQMEQQLNMMIASNDFYDLLFTPWYPGGPQAGIDEGCFIDLNPYLDEYMPDYKAALECTDGSFGDWEWGSERDLYQPQPERSFLDSCTSFDGSLWCVTQIWTDAFMPECGPVIRKAGNC